MKRKLLSAFLVLSVLLSVLFAVAIPASAADASAKLDLYDGETLVGSYTKVQDALNAVTKDGMTLKQTADIWAKKDSVLWFNNCIYDITFDGNGFKMNYYPDTQSGYGFFEIGSGITGDILFRNLQVTLTDDTGTNMECFFGEFSAAGAITFENCSYHGFRGAMLVKSGTVNLIDCDFSVDYGSVIRTHITSDDATVNIYSGTYTAKPDVSTSWYAGTCHINRGTLNVYGGSITGVDGEAIHTVKNGQAAYAPVLNLFGGYIISNASTGTMSSTYGKSKWNIYGGTVVNTGTGHALYPQDAESVNVWNGNFHVTSDTKFPFFGANSAPSYIYGGIFTGGMAAYKVNNPNAHTYQYPAGAKTVAYGNYYNPIMITGAQVRLSQDGTNGIRFTSVIKKGDNGAYQNIMALVDERTTLSYGTLIAPKDSVAEGEFTIDALKAAGKPYLDIPAVDGITETDGTITLRAAMIGIKEENKAREFAAVSYIKATIQGAEVIFYSKYTSEDNARSIRYIATAALNDLQDLQSDEYAYAVTVGEETKYSPYSPALRAVLEGYLS